MGIRPVVFLVPSLAAAVELPRRLASTGRAVAGLYPFKVRDLARAIAEPALLGRGLLAWGPGHDALLAARLLEESAGPRGLRLAPDLPRAPVAAALARTLTALRRAGLAPARLDAVAEGGAAGEDKDRLRAVAALYRGFHDAIEGRFADPATLLRAAREHLPAARWLRGAEVLIVDDLELDGLEAAFVSELARALPVRVLRHERPQLAPGSFSAWAAARGIEAVDTRDTVLAPLAPPPARPGLARLRAGLFDPPAGEPARDPSVELLTGPGEAAEVRGIVRRLLRAAADGVPFEEMGVLLPRPDPYAPLITDLLQRLGIPHRLHPSLPLRTGRAARSLLLLFRCRGLARAAVLEFLTFAPVPFEELLAAGETPRTAQWDAISREAGVVSGLDRWAIGLQAHAAAERADADREPDAERRERRERRAGDALALLRLVEKIAETQESLSGEATWPEWADRLQAALDRWIARGRDRDAVAGVVADLRGLGFLERRASWRDVEAVIEARFEWERVPLEPLSTGAIHVGALDAMAGLPFRVVAIPGLVEGGYPGVIRPDPFLLDPEREALARIDDAAAAGPARGVTSRPAAKGQLRLFTEEPAPPPPADPAARLPTTQDRLLEARRDFHRAVSQATDRLILSYPRADPRTGRERMPSLFFVAAASAREGRPVGAADLERIVVEDDLDALPVEDAVDRSERDRRRVRAGGNEAILAVAGGSPFFRQSRLASQARWSKHLTPYDGLVAFSPRDGVSAEIAAAVRRQLDPVTADRPVSASRLAAFSRCGFLYLMQYVLRLEPAREPEERKRLDPLERGSVFHEVAERFLRGLRDAGQLPVRDTPETRRRVLEVADRALDALVAGSPPRYTVLWERERARFHAGVLKWLEREAAAAGDAVPAWFEVGFGMSRDPESGEPHRREPLQIDLGGRTLRVSGQIDRIDKRPDGTLVLRDYKTGKAPRDENGLFRGAKQLQIPFYILAAGEMFPGHRVVEAFLDYVDGGRQVALDPASVQGEEFGALLRGLVDAIADGLFIQEPTSCTWCDYTAACGPAPLLERRRQYKINDARVQRVLRLREIG